MKKKNSSSSDQLILLNTLSSIIQIIITSLSFFVIYKIIIFFLGVELLGIWSLVISTSSITNLANLGFSSSLVKFIANSKQNKAKINQYIQTAYLSISVLLGVITISIYYLSSWVLPLIIPSKYLNDVKNILPISLLCFWINGISSIFTSVLDGFHLIYKKNLIIIFSSIALVTLSYFLIDKGIVGIAYSQFVQSIILLITSIFFIYKRTKSLLFLKLTWKKIIFKEILNYGGKIQIIGFLNLFWEPVTKYFFSYYGNLASLGIYEMASRLVTQVRNIIVQSNQSIIPYIASKDSLNNNDIIAIYNKNVKIVLITGLPLIIGLISISPYISMIWIKKINLFFLFTLIILSFGWLINIISAPSYFINMATGKLNPLIITHSIYAFLNPFLCLILGFFFESFGIILSVFISIFSGSIFTIYQFHLTYNIKFIILHYTNEIMTIIIFYTYHILSSWLIFLAFNQNLLLSLSVYFLNIICTYILILRKNKYGKNIIKWCTTNIFNFNK